MTMEQAQTLTEGTRLVWHAGDRNRPSRIMRVTFLYTTRRRVVVQSKAGPRWVQAESLWLDRGRKRGRSSWYSPEPFRITRSIPWRELPEWLRR